LIAGYIYCYGFLGRHWWDWVISKGEMFTPAYIRHIICFVSKNPDLSNESIWSFGSSTNAPTRPTQQGEQLEFSDNSSFQGSGRVLGTR
jgi:hypothetical protein